MAGISELLTSASTGVNSAWTFLSQNFKGIAAIVAFLTALALLIKHWQDVLGRQLQSKKTLVDMQKGVVDTKKAQQEMVSKQLEDLKYDHDKLTACVSLLATSASELFNDLHGTFAPLTKPETLKKKQWDVRLIAVNNFKNERKNRPRIEQANAELEALAKLNDPDPAIEDLRARTAEFLQKVSEDDCFIGPLKKCEGRLDKELAGRIKGYMDQTREAHNRLPPLVGTITGKLPRRPAQQV